MMFARGVSRGMKICASRPARAAYAASAPPAFPALGAAGLLAPRYFAIETATLIPRALKLCVGFSDSSLIQRSMSPAKSFARSSGRDSASPTIHAAGRTRCIADASETFPQWSVQPAQQRIVGVMVTLVAASLWKAQRLAQAGGYSLRLVLDLSRWT